MYRFASIAALTLMAVLAASTANAAPIDGIYLSHDITGGIPGFLTGRWSESYLTGLPDVVGNVGHSASWDGTTLGGQWEIQGITFATSQIVASNLSGGNGSVTYNRVFDTSSATATLQNTSWWSGSGDAAYTVDLDSYVQNLTVFYFQNNPIFANSVESFHGTFIGPYTNYTMGGQAGAVLVGMGANLPSGFPSWAPATPYGAWGNVGFVQIVIDHEVVPEPATLALMGLGGAAALLRRKKRA